MSAKIRDSCQHVQKNLVYGTFYCDLRVSVSPEPVTGNWRPETGNRFQMPIQHVQKNLVYGPFYCDLKSTRLTGTSDWQLATGNRFQMPIQHVQKNLVYRPFY